jgi:hypothetical protein
MFGGATLEGGINGRRRSAKTWWAATPDTPTFDEAGVPGLHASFWHGLWAPRGTPKDVIAILHAEPQCDRKQGNTPRILASRAITFMCVGALETTTDRQTMSAV